MRPISNDTRREAEAARIAPFDRTARQGVGRLRALALPVSAVLSLGCSSLGSSPGAETVELAADLRSGVERVLGAASACDLAVVSASRDEERGAAVLHLLGDWRSPRPESALVTVRIGPGSSGVSVALEAHPLAEYGMKPPSAEGSDGGCTPCEAARQKTGLVQYSTGLATGSSHRARRCVRAALTGGVPER